MWFVDQLFHFPKFGVTGVFGYSLAFSGDEKVSVLLFVPVIMLTVNASDMPCKVIELTCAFKAVFAPDLFFARIVTS
jgi:hypothetical protein